MSVGIVVQLAVDCIAAASLYALVGLAVSLAFSGSGTYHLAREVLRGGLDVAHDLTRAPRDFRQLIGSKEQQCGSSDNQHVSRR